MCTEWYTLKQLNHFISVLLRLALLKGGSRSISKFYGHTFFHLYSTVGSLLLTVILVFFPSSWQSFLSLNCQPKCQSAPGLYCGSSSFSYLQILFGNPIPSHYLCADNFIFSTSQPRNSLVICLKLSTGYLLNIVDSSNVICLKLLLILALTPLLHCKLFS